MMMLDVGGGVFYYKGGRKVDLQIRGGGWKTFIPFFWEWKFRKGLREREWRRVEAPERGVEIVKTVM